MTAAAATLVAASAEQVWETIYAPETLGTALPKSVFCGGHVPGTPERQVHEMRYQIMRAADRRLYSSIFAVTEIVPGHSILVQETSSGIEAYHLLTPAAEGTRVELEWRAPARAVKWRHRGSVIHSTTAGLQATLNGYKAVLEGSSEPEERSAHVARPSTGVPATRGPRYAEGPAGQASLSSATATSTQLPPLFVLRLDFRQLRLPISALLP